MKRISVVLLVFMMIILTGCKRSDKTNIKETEETDDNIKEEYVHDPIDNIDYVTIDKQVLLDHEGIKITALRLNEYFGGGPDIDLRIENNSEHNISIEIKEASINDLMISPNLFCQVAAGEKIEDIILIPLENMNHSGIDIISKLEFKLYIENTDNYDIIIYTDVITINTSAKDYVQKYDDSGDVVYDKNDIKIVFKGLDTSDNYIGSQILFYIENNNNQTIAIGTENFLTNGNSEYGGLYRELTPGKKAIAGIKYFYFNGKKFDEDVKNVEFNFGIYDYNTIELIDTSDLISLSFE